jgi:Mg2+/Co2+ transporter CorB
MSFIGLGWPAAIGILVFLLLASAFFSGSETALTRANRVRLRLRSKEGNDGAKRAEKMLETPERLLAAILLGNNFVNIAASSLAAVIFVEAFGEIGVIYATVAMTVVILVFSEILPKTIAVAHAETIASHVSTPMQWIMRLLAPLIAVLMTIVDLMKRLLRIPKNKPTGLDHKELATIIDMSAETGHLDAAREQMLANSLSLHEVPVKALMTPKHSMVMLNADKSVGECLQEAIRQPHSRYPVYSGSGDRLLGIIHLRDLIRVKDEKGTLAEAMVWQNPPYIPASKNALAQLFDFQARHQHMAIVVDEYGDIEGLITLEDIIEEIVGEIADESDLPQTEEMWLQPDGSLIVSGTCRLHDINQMMEIDLPEEGATTIGGYLVDLLGEQPQGRLCVQLDKLHIEILELSGRKIRRVRLCRLA